MQAVASSIFQVVQFPFQGKIVTIDQLDFYSLDKSSNSTNNVPLLASSALQYQNIGVGILKYSSLMGVFPLNSPPSTSHVVFVNMISTSSYDTLDKEKSIVDLKSLSHLE